MRVISGNRKGRSLEVVPGMQTRPTTDKVKEAIFNLIGRSYFEGGMALDLYAGTGGLGIEALSRGFEKVIFVDMNGKAIQTIKKNLKTMDYLNHSEVYKNEASRALKALTKRDIKFDLVFLDPPYAKQQIAAQLEIVHENHLLNPGGIIIVESGKEVHLPEVVGDICLHKFQQYGDTEIRIYTRKGK